MSVLNTESLETKVNGFAKKNKIIRLRPLQKRISYCILQTDNLYIYIINNIQE